MREIKFRGRLDTGEWVYGGFHKHQMITLGPVVASGEERKPIEYAYLIIKSGFSDWNLPKPIEGHEVDRATIGQYTGLHDKNGKEIYEGDIIAANKGKNRFVVDWEKGAFIRRAVFIAGEDGEPVMPLDPIHTLHSTPDVKKAEVIGNVHEHPELLEGEDESQEESILKYAGCVPGVIGDMSIQDYIDWVRAGRGSEND